MPVLVRFANRIRGPYNTKQHLDGADELGHNWSALGDRVHHKYHKFHPILPAVARFHSPYQRFYTLRLLLFINSRRDAHGDVDASSSCSKGEPINPMS